MNAHVRQEQGLGQRATYRLSWWTRLRLSWMQTREYMLWSQSLSLRVWK